MDWISSLLLATVRLAIPVLLISLAELYGQRAGMVNIGLEGLAAIGALVGFLVCYITGSNWLGLLCGALAGIAVNMIYAFSTITLCANHTVYGMAINIFAPALASFIYRVYFGTGSDLKQIVTMSSVAIPGLKDIPIIGGLLFDQSPMVYLTFLLVLFTAIFFGKTRAGLSYKAVGEHPQADDHRRVLPLADDRRRIVVHIHHIICPHDFHALRQIVDAVATHYLQDFLRLPPGFKQHLIRLNLCVLQRCRAGGRLLSAALLRLLHRRQRVLCLRSLPFLGLQLFRIWKQICLSLRVGRTLPYIKQ